MQSGAPELSFVRAVGGRLSHVTARVNLARIVAEGLRPAAMLAQAAGIDPGAIRLRAGPVVLPCGAMLNHQRPLRAGRGAAFLDGLTLEDWSGLLDERVFLWPGRRGAAFAGSMAGRDAVRLTVDPARLFATLADHIWLSPINSGNATRKPAQRGPWIWVPARDAGRIAEKRRARGLVAGRDGVVEVSVTGVIPPDLIEVDDGR